MLSVMTIVWILTVLLNIALLTRSVYSLPGDTTMTDYKKDTSTAAAAVPESELTLQEVFKENID
jgi:hypothetical protein